MLEDVEDDEPALNPDIFDNHKEGVYDNLVPIQNYPSSGYNTFSSKSHYEQRRAQSTKPTPRLLIDAGKSASEGFSSKAFDPEFINKMKEIERIARQVDAELGQITSPHPVAPLGEDAREIEDAIFRISDELLHSRPITEAQAEASEELLRTTLADMILNPSRTAEEEMELMRRPIRLLKRKLSDFENSLMEDVEVTKITEQSLVPSTVISPIEDGSDLIAKTRVPSADYLRVTPLTTNIKEQLSCLEEMINSMGTEAIERGSKEETPSDSTRSGTRKKRELHDLLVQINNEMNTIKSFCKSKLSKKGTDTVVSVLQKVKAHVNSIVNVISISKKKQEIQKYDAYTSLNLEFFRSPAKERIDAIMFYKKTSLESSMVQQTSTAASTSDDTWRYSTELKTSTEKTSDSKSESKAERKSSEETLKAEPIPKAPPRRRRTQSAEPECESIEIPVRPPRNKKSVEKRDHSLDSRLKPVEKKKSATLP
ncbi:unnamed protein product, partial [Cylicostephanus goldi]